MNARYTLGYGREVSSRTKWQRLVYTMPIYGPSLEQVLWQAVPVDNETAASPHIFGVSASGGGKTQGVCLPIALRALEQGSLVALVGDGPLFLYFLREAVARKLSPMDICLLDPCHRHTELGSPRLAPLTPLPGQTKRQAAEKLVEDCMVLSQRLSTPGPRQNDAAFYLFRLLQLENLPLSAMHTVAYNTMVRDAYIARCPDPETREWWQYFVTELNSNQQAITLEPVVNKFSPLLRSEFTASWFSETASTVDIPSIINRRGRALVADLSSRDLNKDPAESLAQVLFSQLKAAILQRAAIPEAERVPLTVLCDEYHFIRSPGVMGDLYRLSRNYGVSMVTMTQDLTAFDDAEIRSICGNSGTIMVMGCGDKEGERLALELYKPTGTQRKSWTEREGFYSIYEEVSILRRLLGKQEQRQAVTLVNPKGLYFMRTPTRERPQADPLLEGIFRQIVARYWYRPPTMVS